MSYAICFDFPHGGDPEFAGWRFVSGKRGGEFVLTPFLGSALQFGREDDAQRTLDNSFQPDVAEYGRVVEVLA